MFDGLDLNALPDRPGQWKRVVACLNVWNDIDELQRTVPTWKDLADVVVVADGEYETGAPSDDGSYEYLCDVLGSKMDYFGCRDAAWMDQQEKRTSMFERCRPGDLLLVVDADETLEHPYMALAEIDFDVGWVHMASPLYKRSQQQPRLFKYRPGLRYDGRHHWIYERDRLVCTHQQGAPGYDHRLLPIKMHNSRGKCRTPERKRAVMAARSAQTDAELQIGPKVTAHEPLRILHVGPFDAGHAVHRLHTAINTTTPHHSDMAVGAEPHPCQPPKQYDLHAPMLPQLVEQADIIHHHVLRLGNRVVEAPIEGKPMVMHHHGTEYRRDPERWNQEDTDRNALRLVSNVELLQYGENLHFLPNPVPVAQYRALAKNKPRWDGKTLRVAHSPTKPEIKGTQAFTAVCEKLRKQDVNVEPVLIHGKTLRESLEIKATCHAVFDSFDLGMQCSGLEGAAMGLPVVAGDTGCVSRWMDLYGYCPYVYAGDAGELEWFLKQLIDREDFYESAAKVGLEHVAQHHDYGAVTGYYLELLDTHFGWREALQLNADLQLPMRAAVAV